jgi:hypothetical protein
MDADLVIGRGTRQQSTINRNLPESGPISAANPRPVATLSSVLAYENLTKSSYELETQLRQRPPAALVRHPGQGNRRAPDAVGSALFLLRTSR